MSERRTPAPAAGLVLLAEWRPKPDPTVVETLRDLLEQARAGDLRAIAFVTEAHRGEWDAGIVGTVSEVERITYGIACVMAELVSGAPVLDPDETA